MFRCTMSGILLVLSTSFLCPVLSSVSCNGCAATHRCVGNSNVQAVEDADCELCASGQTWWPCDIENLCFCWDPSTPRVPPPPSSGLDFATTPPCDLLTEEKFNALTGGAHQAPYTYVGLCAAIADYNELHPTEHVFKMGTLEQQKAEIAAFLGNTLHESDMFKAPREYIPCGDSKVVNGKTFCKPCISGAFDWGTKQCSASQVAAGGAFTNYCDPALSPPGACSCGAVMQAGSSNELVGYMEADKAFFGRGAIQLSWNYNYIRASAALTGDPDTFCANPDLVATVEKYAWGAGIFFWMENMRTEQGSLSELSTCHIQALSGDIGGTLWNINGNQECPPVGEFHTQAVVMRINYYCRAASVMGVSSLLSFAGCNGMTEAFSNCDHSLDVSQGGCPDCGVWKHASTTNAMTTSTTVADLETTSSAVDTDTSTSHTTSMTTSSSTGIVSSTLTTTRTGTHVCVDNPLPDAWSGGGVHSCSTYNQHGGLEYCSHAELNVACCFCGGGQQTSTAVFTSTTAPRDTSTTTMTVTTTLSATAAETTVTTTLSQAIATTTTMVTTTFSALCVDAPLAAAWSAGGVHTCSTYEQHGGMAYCAHKELEEACCFCRAGQSFSALSLQGGSMQASPQGIVMSTAFVLKPTFLALLTECCFLYYSISSLHR